MAGAHMLGDAGTPLGHAEHNTLTGIAPHGHAVKCNAHAQHATERAASCDKCNGSTNECSVTAGTAFNGHTDPVLTHWLVASSTSGKFCQAFSTNKGCISCEPQLCNADCCCW